MKFIYGLGVEVHSLAFSPDASRLLGMDLGGMLKIWDVATGRHLATANLGGFHLSSERFSPDGRRVALMSVRVWDATPQAANEP
jgi:WD40 repeat protein